MTRPWLAFVISVLLIGVAVSASAQEPGETDEISEARALFIAGRSAFNEGRYEAALDYFQRSYSLSGRSMLLFNVAQCLDRLRRDDEALAAFEKYLHEVPEAENRAEVESRIAILKSAMASRQQAPAPAAQPVAEEVPWTGAPPVDSESGSSAVAPQSPGASDADSDGAPTAAKASSFPIGPVITLAAGGVAAIIGAVFMIGAQSTASAVENVEPGQRTAVQLQSDISAAQGQWMAGQLLVGVGAAAVAGGALWLVLETGQESNAGVALHVQPTGMQLSGRF